eukprot:TRINITY_DN10707_c0_g1_i19.p1 TRINITY_DN10707_c0_g1~~TRINITY_DN10707_c0_g1_i19.p1  ORF type:complete len:184 (+),score=18.65 TRINITY_DN10707_c0_g1_i19:87-638(+)
MPHGSSRPPESSALLSTTASLCTTKQQPVSLRCRKRPRTPWLTCAWRSATSRLRMWRSRSCRRRTFVLPARMSPLAPYFLPTRAKGALKHAQREQSLQLDRENIRKRLEEVRKSGDAAQTQSAKTKELAFILSESAALKKKRERMEEEIKSDQNEYQELYEDSDRRETQIRVMREELRRLQSK